MKKTVSLIFVLLFSAVYAVADDISREQALQIASQFASHTSTQQLSRRRAPAQPATPTLAHSMKSQVQQGKDNVYIVNLGNDQGFVVVSGESGTGDEVLGYCDHGTFSYDDCPVQLQDLLQGYATGIDSLRRNPAMAAPRRAVKTWPDYIGSIVVGPLLTTTWNQWVPYNDLCPQAESWGGQYGGRAPTGCYPTALAQVMNYWKWPETTIGTVRNEDFSGRHYDWDNMLDDYSQGYNSQQARAVAQLMADIGKAFGTVYGQDNGSPTTFGYLQLANNFGYQPDINIERGITAADLMDKMKKELDEKRPIIYCAFPDIEKEQDAHALVCDGYTDQDYFHFNYGWGGKADGFYKNAMATGYCYAAEMFTGVRPYVAVRKVIDGIEYALLKNGTAEVTDYTLGKGGRENGDVTIPAVVSDDEGKQYRVTSIRTHAFYSKGHFGKLTLGENVESIDRFAFMGVSIKELVLSDKMVNVPDESFYTIPINKLTIGASVKSIGYRAFGLSGLSEITCKSEAFEVGDQAFFMCTNLDCGEWLSHITKIGKSAFTGANFHTAPDFKRLVEVGSKAFQSCRFAGNTFTVPKTLKRIAPDAFDGSTLSWFVVKDNPNFYCAKDQMGYLCNSSGTSLIMTVSNPVMPIGNPNMDAFPDNMVRMEPGSIRARGNICIPSTIVEMEGAFKDCNPFVTLRILTKVPPVITEATFSEKFFDDDPWLFVPEGSVELYANAPVWNRFYIATDDREYGPLPVQERQYQMVVNATTDDPDAQMIREYKDEMGFWQSVGLDGIYNAVTSISEPLLDFKPEALDHAVTAMGYLGTALSILDVVGADIKGDDVGVLKGTLSTVLNYTSGQMAAAIGTPIMAASSACVAFIGIALDKLYTSVMEHKVDMFREAYRYYYSMKGFNDLIGSSNYKVDEKNPHGFYRTTKDWYDHFYPIIAEGRLSKDRLEGVIEQTVRMYCNRFWDDNEEVRTWSYDYAKTQGLSSYMWISQSDMDQISDEYYAELMNGPMVSVVAAIKRNIAAEADVRYKKALERVAAIVNTQYRLRISDSSAPKDGKSKYAGWKMRFNDVPSTVADPKQWECVIADDGTATLGPVTVFSMLQNEMPFSVTLCDLNGTEKKTWNFQISENTGKRGIKVDLATSGIEVEVPKLSNLILTYAPDIVEIPYTWDGYLYSYDDENNIRKEPASVSGAIDIRLDGSLNKRARFQYEVEKFFKQHDFISVDPSGHIKIGDDIVGTMKGNEGSGKFTINTTHPFVEKTKQQFVYDFNHIWSKEGDIFGLWNLLNGTISHKIDCEFTVVRSEADDSYVVTYTGAGTYKFMAEGVALIENFNQTAFQNGEVMHNTVDDISTGITEAEGKVTLSYTTKLQ